MNTLFPSGLPLPLSPSFIPSLPPFLPSSLPPSHSFFPTYLLLPLPLSSIALPSSPSLFLYPSSYSSSLLLPQCTFFFPLPLSSITLPSLFLYPSSYSSSPTYLFLSSTPFFYHSSFLSLSLSLHLFLSFFPT